jgi:cytochrome P450 PksS
MGVEPEERASFHVMLEQALDMSQPWRMLLRTPTYIRLYRFFERLLARKRADPQDDLISALVTAEEEGDRLSPQELMGTVFLLLLAGHETTVNLIGNGALALLEHPAQAARLRAQPDLIPSAVEEMLRFYSPANTTSTRFVAEPVTLGGVTLKRGDVVMPILGAANRDAHAFETPGNFDVGRDPNPHLAFGAGVHFCIGAHLSRLEAKIAFEVLLERFGEMHLGTDRDRLVWRGATTGLRGLATLPVAVG